MFPFRRSFLSLALATSASLSCSSPALMAQASSSAQPDPPAAASAAQAPASNQGQMTVAARIKARREARRAAAIQEIYTHRYDAEIGMGYLRFHPGPTLQRLNEYAWNMEVTRYFSERLGVAVDGRGTYGTAFTGVNVGTNSFINKPSISQYAGMIGPTYRFLLNPKYSVSGRVLAGAGYGKFSGDLGAFTTAAVGLYPNGASPEVSASAPIEYNVSPALGLRLAPEYVFTKYGSQTQNSLGYTFGVIVRWGKQ